MRLGAFTYFLALIFVAAAAALLPSAVKGTSDKTGVQSRSKYPPPVSLPSNEAPSEAIPDGSEATIRRVLSVSEAKKAVDVGLLPTGARSVLQYSGPLRFGQFVWNDRGVPQGPLAVVVDLPRQLISVFRAGHEIGNAVIIYGADQKETPSGTLRVLAKMKDHRSSTYDAEMPYTLRLTSDGVSIHGSDVRWGTATHGCIGVPTEFARLLFAQVAVGQPIFIRK